MSEWVRALAPAKLNLRLEVLGRRDDGFHELVTDMLAVDLCDELRARRCGGDGLQLSVSGPAANASIPSGDDNLAQRAARLVQDEARRRGRDEVGLELVLEKHVPSEAGLGGASSDAAAAMLLAARVLELDLEHEWMGERLAELGSDCRFFLDAAKGFARCTGRGERIAPHELPRDAGFLALATPAARCPTAAVFAALRAPYADLPPPALLGVESSWAALAASRGNHLQEAAFEASADFGAWREVLSRVAADDAWSLSGSGSSLFTPCATKSEAEAALARLGAAARARGVGLRLECVVRPAFHGARILD